MFLLILTSTCSSPLLLPCMKVMYPMCVCRISGSVGVHWKVNGRKGKWLFPFHEWRKIFFSSGMQTFLHTKHISHKEKHWTDMEHQVLFKYSSGIHHESLSCTSKVDNEISVDLATLTLQGHLRMSEVFAFHLLSSLIKSWHQTWATSLVGQPCSTCGGCVEWHTRLFNMDHNVQRRNCRRSCLHYRYQHHATE